MVHVYDLSSQVRFAPNYTASKRYLIGPPGHDQYPTLPLVVSTAGGAYPKPVYPGGQLIHNVSELVNHERTQKNTKIDSFNKLLDFKSIGPKKQSGIDKQAVVAFSLRSMCSFVVNTLSPHTV